MARDIYLGGIAFSIGVGAYSAGMLDQLQFEQISSYGVGDEDDGHYYIFSELGAGAAVCIAGFRRGQFAVVLLVEGGLWNLDRLIDWSRLIDSRLVALGDTAAPASRPPVPPKSAP